MEIGGCLTAVNKGRQICAILSNELELAIYDDKQKINKNFSSLTFLSLM
jgi:hypothetical protein